MQINFFVRDHEPRLIGERDGPDRTIGIGGRHAEIWLYFECADDIRRLAKQLDALADASDSPVDPFLPPVREFVTAGPNDQPF